MAYLPRRVSTHNESGPIELDPNPNPSRKFFEDSILTGVAHSGAYLDTMG